MDTYNSQTYGSGSPLLSASQDNIVINGFGIQNSYICTSLLDEGNIIDFTNFNFPKSNGRGLLGYYERGKNFEMQITLKGDTAEDFQTRLDNLRKYIFQPEVNLDIKVNGVVRRIKVNCLSARKTLNHYNITFLKTTLRFETLEPFLYELSNQTSSFLGKTSSFDEYIYNNGTAVSELRIFLNFQTGISGTDSIAVTIGDKTLTINQAISDNDSIVINGEEGTVLYNDGIVDWDGEFPLLDIDGNAINFTINGTFNIDINVLNKVNYV